MTPMADIVAADAAIGALVNCALDSAVVDACDGGVVDVSPFSS